MRNLSVSPRLWFALIVILFFAIHTGLFLFDVTDPAAVIRGDRASDRLAKLNELFAASRHSLEGIIFNSGVPGDFLQHAILYSIGGPYLLIGFQIALQFIILVTTFLAAVRLTGSATVAVATGFFVLVMPGALLNPHLLVTETWFTLLLTIGTFAICQAVKDTSKRDFLVLIYIGFASFGLASSIRPQGLLVPLALAAYLSIARFSDRRTILGATVLAYAMFPISWMTLRLLFVGDFGLGASNADLSTNLALRADRILGLPLDTTGRMGPSAFLALAAGHPLATFNSVYTDAFNLILNPGANHLFGYYLGLGETPDGFSWLRIRDEAGVFGVIAELLRRNLALVALFVTWTAIHAVVILGVCKTVLSNLRANYRTPSWVWVALIVVATTAASGFVAGLVRWNLRAGVEPLLALLAAYGWFSNETAFGSARKIEPRELGDALLSDGAENVPNP